MPSGTSAAGPAPLPLFLNLVDQPCLVVGAGTVATRKIDALLRAGAQVTVVAPRFCEAAESLAASASVRAQHREFREADVQGQLLVIAAAGWPPVNRRVFEACRASGVLVNTVDDAALSSAMFPAVVARGAVAVAVSTGGASPALARRIRERIEAVLPASTARLAEFLGRNRRAINARFADARARRSFWDAALDGPVPDLIEAGDEAAAERALEQLAQATGPAAGFVSLVGAGPGDPDLLTLKALRALQRADVVYHDRLVSAAVLERCRRDAQRVYVGKRRAFGGARQAEINQLLLEGARKGLRVVRLKGGDPFLFGRGGEEVETLGESGVDFEIIPGVTAALGCAAYAGIPLTHRDWAQSVRFVTGHLQGGEVNLDWPELAKPGQTLVVYMSLAGLGRLAAQLMKHGMDADMPVATVSRGTLPDQAVVVAPLANIAEAVERAGLPAPTTTIIGRVVSLRGSLRKV